MPQGRRGGGAACLEIPADAGLSEGGSDEANMKSWGLFRLAGAVLAAALGVAAASAAEPGHAVPNQIGFQVPVTEVSNYIVWFHNDILMPVITLISLFVLALLIYVVYRFNGKSKPHAVQDHPQHADRSAVDGRPGADPGVHRRAVVPPADAGNWWCRRPTSR